MKTVIAWDVAEADINAWLDKKKVGEKTRETNKDYIETLIEAVSNGTLTLDKDDEKSNKAGTYKFKHTLLFPFEGDAAKDSLEYECRINDRMMKPNLNGVKLGDGDGRFNALIATLTRQPRTLIEQLDTADKKIAMAIGIFFL